MGIFNIWLNRTLSTIHGGSSTLMNYNNDFRHDLAVGQLGEQALGTILEHKKIEVKTDLQAKQTGNVFVEYRSRGKLSGISTSEADYWCFIVSNYQLAMIATGKLKELARQNWSRQVKGGDSNTSDGVLVTVTDLLK